MKLRLPLVLLFAATGCGPDLSDPGDGVRPEDDGASRLQQGLVTCAPRTETGYRSGRAFPIVVVQADGKPAEVATANAYHVMQEAAAADGVALRVVSGFRSQAEQRYLYRCYTQCSCNNCNLAAYPGYSNHQSGSALDLNTADRGVYRWLARNGARFGFYETVPGEDWHWEFFGPSPGAGPCAEDGRPAAPPGPRLSFVSPQHGGRYTNGLWLKANVSEPVALVRYFADGWFLGASEDAEDDYAVRHVFEQLGRRTLRAEAIDAEGRIVARREIEVEVAEGASPRARLQITSPRLDGWYRNGVELRAEASEQVVAVTYSAGPWVLGRSTDRAAGFPLRVVFSQLGWRTVRAVGVDPSGAEVARRSISVRVLPGEEGPVALRVVSPTPGTKQRGEVRFSAVGSDSVARVVYSADGWTFGEARAEDDFEVRYRFNQAGTRRVMALGLDAAGRELAEHTFEIEVQ